MIKKITICAAVILLFTTQAFSQTYEVPSKPLKRHEVSVGYGGLPVTDFVSILGTVFGSMFTGQVHELNHLTGAIYAGYTYRINKIVGLGGTFAYSGSSFSSESVGVYYNNFYSIMAQAKFNWVNTTWFTLYTRLNLGLTLLSQSRQASTDTNTVPAFMLQITPIGFEVGKSFAGYAEVGFGATGIIAAGVRYRF